jgi:alpha-D-xyloside xylohydrolase
VVPEQGADTALVGLALGADGSFLTGLGEQYDHVSATGRVTPMFLTLSGKWQSGTNEAHVPVPFLVSSAGWGVFVSSREAGAFDVGATDPGTIRATFEGRALDVWVFVDPDPLAIVARFNRLVGLPRPLPRWALSLFHWAHWASDVDVLGVAREYRARHIPSSSMWLDDGWQTALDTFVISPGVFADAPSTMDQLGALGYRVLAWTTPYLEKPQGAPANEAQALYPQAEAAGFFVKDDGGQTYVSPATPVRGGAGIIDFTNDGAQTFWEGLVARATQSGLHGFKCDYGEELIPNLLGQRDPVRFADGTTARTARLYPIEEHATYHAALDAAFPGDGLLIVRASSWGGAAQADVVWPGDLDSAFEHQGDPLPQGGLAVGGLPAAIVAAQTLATSGFPAFGSDTAGYRGTPTRESMLRWIDTRR